MIGLIFSVETKLLLNISIYVIFLFENLTETIPDEIGLLYNLNKLFINTNKSTGSISLTIFNNSSLEILVMGNNILEGPLPRGWKVDCTWRV